MLNIEININKYRIINFVLSIDRLIFNILNSGISNPKNLFSRSDSDLDSCDSSSYYRNSCNRARVSILVKLQSR